MMEAEAEVLQRKPRDTKGCPPPLEGRGKEGSSRKSQRERGPADTLTFGFLLPEL